MEWLIETGAGRQSLRVLNFDDLTPLTLAARLGTVELFRHIL